MARIVRCTRVVVVARGAIREVGVHAPDRAVARTVATLIVQTTHQLLALALSVAAERIHDARIVVVAITAVGFLPCLTHVQFGIAIGEKTPCLTTAVGRRPTTLRFLTVRTPPGIARIHCTGVSRVAIDGQRTRFGIPQE